MKILVKKRFRYQADCRTLREIEPGVHDLPKELAEKVLRFGEAEIVKKSVKKPPPENKVVTVTANKAKVARKTGYRRSARTKPDE
jgi:hypothetical protein